MGMESQQILGAQHFTGALAYVKLYNVLLCKLCTGDIFVLFDWKWLVELYSAIFMLDVFI